jgi:hydrogenase nickel incorporation protein HypA/HybF
VNFSEAHPARRRGYRCCASCKAIVVREWTRVHELAIAASIVEIASRHAAGRRVTKVMVKVGHLRQVVPSALAFSFEVVTAGTPLQGAALEIEAVPAVGVCRQCGAQSRLHAFPLQCRACGGYDLQIVAGEELIVESLELEEAGRGAHGDEDAGRGGRAER